MSLLKERLKLEERESNRLLGGRRFPIQEPNHGRGVTPEPLVESEGEECLED